MKKAPLGAFFINALGIMARPQSGQVQRKEQLLRVLWTLSKVVIGRPRHRPVIVVAHLPIMSRYGQTIVRAWILTRTVFPPYQCYSELREFMISKFSRI